MSLNKHFKKHANKIANHLQIGGIETSILDNGRGRGTRIAWINTGSGLRYKLILDRAMDIADAHYMQHNVAWLSHVGVTKAYQNSNLPQQWLNNFGGGLLTTCGLTNVGEGAENDLGIIEMNGAISNEPAEIVSIIQPNLMDEKPKMSITSLIKETSSFGKHIELRRTIYSYLGESSIYISDEVTNYSNIEIPHMILYHCNFGWPIVDKDTIIFWDGEWKPRSDSFSDNYIFNDRNNFKICKDLTQISADFNGDACCFINPIANHDNLCTTGLINKKLNLTAKITFNKNQLPLLTNWQHYKSNEYVIGIEPGNTHPIGQARARETGQLLTLKPNETKKYNLHIEFSNNVNS